MTLPSTRTLTIGFAVAGGVAAIALVVIPRNSAPHHSAVYRYVTSVDAVEARMSYALSNVQSAYRAVTVGHSTSAATRKKFVTAERTLRVLDKRIAGLPPPPEAAKLRKLVLRLVRQEIAATHEVTALVAFLPRFDAVLADLRASATTLAQRLGAAQAPAPHAIHGTSAQIKEAQAAFTAAATKAALAQADAVTAYGAVLANETRRLRALSPPPVLEPAYRYQLVALHRTSVAGAKLVAALKAATRTNIAQLSRSFAVASRSSQSVAEQRAEVAAVKAYDARLGAIGTTTAAIHKELTRLQASEH
ncbi:MAG: hypothetical protein ACRDL2_06285 [Gaiellaceae bacterium]